MNNKKTITSVTRFICWASFLFLNLWSWGIPLGAVYLPEQAGLVNLVGQFFAMLIFTGFIVVVAYEYLRKCFITTKRTNATLLFLLFSLLLPVSYYVVSVISAHTNVVTTLISFLIWFCSVGLLGYLIEGEIPSKKTFKFTVLFALIGVFIFAFTSIGWSFIYGYIIRPSHLSLTPYFSFGGGVFVWVSLLAIVLFLGRGGRYAKP